jgi:hypothetical protein
MVVEGVHGRAKDWITGNCSRYHASAVMPLCAVAGSPCHLHSRLSLPLWFTCGSSTFQSLPGEIGAQELWAGPAMAAAVPVLCVARAECHVSGEESPRAVGFASDDQD